MIQANYISLKWKMHDNNHYEAVHEGYTVVVKPKGGLGPYWSIIKDGVEIDCCFYHSPTKDELTAKVQAERCFNKLLASLTRTELQINQSLIK